MSPRNYNTITAARLPVLWLFLFFVVASPSSSFSQESLPNDTDTIVTSLDEIEVSAIGKAPLGKGGSMNFNPQDFYSSLRIMGEADIVNHIKRLSGVTTSGDYGSGLMIDGAEPSQTLFRINGVPVFFPYRFGGLFSTFNSAYFSSVDFERGIHRGGMPNRLGAKIDFFNSYKIPGEFGGMLNVGMLSSSVDLKIPIGEKFSISFAGRISYVDQVYRPIIKNSLDLAYQFGDLNLNALWKIDDFNTLALDAFGNKDRLKYGDSQYSMDNILTWSNRLLSLTWTSNKKITSTQRFYFSDITNKYRILMPQFSMQAPSSLATLGLQGNFSQWLAKETLNIEYGYEINGYRDNPQKIELTGYLNTGSEPPAIRHTLETRIFGDVRIPLKTRFKIYAGASATYFHNSGYNSVTVDPRVTFNMAAGIGSFNFHFGKYSQYIHQLGFSQIGLASDFWMTADRETPKQASYNFELDYTASYRNLSFSVSAYWKRVLSQPDYIGQVLDLLQPDFKASDHIHIYSGYNTGVNLVANLVIDKFTFDLGAGYGIARRKDPDTGKQIRGNTEPGFTCNADITYRINRHWQLGSQFRFATGRPFTPIVAMYMIAGNLIKEYGPPNSALFPDNHHLDLSATWQCESKLKNRKLTHLVNISVINAYGRKNVEIMTYNFDLETGTISLRKVYSLYRFLPSVSYTLQF